MSHRIAISGLGASTREIYLPAYRSLPYLQVVDGCDPLARAEDFSFPIFRSVPEMLEKTKPDIRVVVTPPDSRFDLAGQGLQAGCHIFCEEPFMNSLEEEDAVIALAQHSGREVVVINQYRFMRIHRAAEAKIGSCDVGDLLFVSMQQTFLGPRRPRPAGADRIRNARRRNMARRRHRSRLSGCSVRGEGGRSVSRLVIVQTYNPQSVFTRAGLQRFRGGRCSYPDCYLASDSCLYHFRYFISICKYSGKDHSIYKHFA